MFVDVLTKILRYVFVLLAGFVVVRGLLWLRKDTKQYKKIIRRLPDAGLIGEICCPANGRKVQLPREGSMGRFTSCDVKLKGSGIRGVHAHFLFIPGKGLRVTPYSGARVQADGRNIRGSAVLLSGSELILGNERFIIRFFMGLNAPRRSSVYPVPGREEDGIYGGDTYNDPIPGYPAPFIGYREREGYAAPEVPTGRDRIPEGWGEDENGAYGSALSSPSPENCTPAHRMSDRREIPTPDISGDDTEDWGPDE